MGHKRALWGTSGLTVLEYAVLMTAIVSALFLSFSYLRRAVEHRWRDGADQFGTGLQYQAAEDGAQATVVIKH
jgi:Flp pilus assembly pilin Flp